VIADVTDADSLDAAFTTVEAELGPVEVVVANAGITRDTLLLRMSEEDFTSVIDTNLTGAFRTVKRASKGMLKARFGRIILISSVVGLYGSAGQVNYSASKSALVGMARSLTREMDLRFEAAGCAELGEAMAKAKSTDPVKVAAALSGLQFKGFNGDSAVRKNDHQMQQGLWISKWQKVDAKNKYSVENTGYTFAPVKYLEAYVASTPTSCDMKKP